jgi:hypothetical protein
MSSGMSLGKDSSSSRRSGLDRSNFSTFCELSPPHPFSIEDIQASLESAEADLDSFLEADVQDVTCFSTKVVSSVGFHIPTSKS